MPRTTAIRVVVAVVCVAGIAGMVVGSATKHIGAVVTSGLVTAVAVLCQMVATTVQNEARGSAPSDLEGAAAALEARVGALVDAGVDEEAVRDLVRHAVRLGRQTQTAAPTDS